MWAMDRISESRKDRVAFYLVMGASVLAFLLRAYRAGDPIGGYHSFNEGWYAEIASNYHGLKSLLFPIIDGEIDFNVPPLLSYILYAVKLVFGESELNYRMVPVVFSTATVGLVYVLGRRYFGRKAGVVSAFFFASMPAAVLVGRNIQADPVFLFFMLASVIIYTGYRERGVPGKFDPAAAGLLFGIALLAKQFAVLIVPAIVLWEMIRTRKLVGWIGRDHIFFGVAALLPLLPFYCYHLIVNLDIIYGPQVNKIATQGTAVSGYAFELLSTEYLWGLSPLVTLFAVAGLAYLLFRRGSGAWLVILALLFFNLFFIKWHGHSYYMLFAVPFFSVAAGALLSRVRNKYLLGLVTLITVTQCAVLTIMILCATKYGFEELKGLAQIVAGQQQKPVVVPTEICGGSYDPVLRFYFPRDIRIIRESGLLKDFGNGKYDRLSASPVFIVGHFDLDDHRFPPMRFIVKRSVYSLFILGYRVDAQMVNQHFYEIDRIITDKRPEMGLKTGVYYLGSVPELLVGVVPPGASIRVKNSMIDYSPDAVAVPSPTK